MDICSCHGPHRWSSHAGGGYRAFLITTHMGFACARLEVCLASCFKPASAVWSHPKERPVLIISPCFTGGCGLFPKYEHQYEQSCLWEEQRGHAEAIRNVLKVTTQFCLLPLKSSGGDSRELLLVHSLKSEEVMVHIKSPQHAHIYTQHNTNWKQERSTLLCTEDVSVKVNHCTQKCLWQLQLHKQKEPVVAAKTPGMNLSRITRVSTRTTQQKQPGLHDDPLQDFTSHSSHLQIAALCWSCWTLSSCSLCCLFFSFKVLICSSLLIWFLFQNQRVFSSNEELIWQ